jgi:hypothetical protein
MFFKIIIKERVDIDVGLTIVIFVVLLELSKLRGHNVKRLNKNHYIDYSSGLYICSDLLNFIRQCLMDS